MQMRTREQIDKSLKSAYAEIDNIVALMFTKKNLTEFLSTTEYILINGYVRGAKDTLEMLGRDTSEIDELSIIPELQTSLNKPIEGMDYTNRIILGFFEKSTKQMQNLVGNEYHRVYNDGAYDIVKKLEQYKNVSALKTWHTMNDDAVRDTHAYLEGESIDIDAYFYTWDGDKARYPGDFERAENNIGCRCVLTYSVF